MKTILVAFLILPLVASCSDDNPPSTNNDVTTDKGGAIDSGEDAGPNRKDASNNDVSSDGGTSTDPVSGPLKAFPSAFGGGADVTGGRGGQVLYVTTLDDSGDGSLREALEAEGPRIVVFSVSGTIVLQSAIVVRNGDLTIAGQTAPAGGITITGTNRLLTFTETDNLIVRYLRVRPEIKVDEERDAVDIIGSSNIIFDHVSVSFGTDENISTRGVANNISFQRLLIAEGKTGSLFGSSTDTTEDAKDLSFHHNVFYNISHRFPNLQSDGRVDVYNNVMFNWKYRWSVVIGDIQLNHMNNYFQQGCLENPSGQNSFSKIFYRDAYEPEIHTAGNLVMPTFLTDPNEDNWQLWNWRVDVTSGPFAGALANTQLTDTYQVQDRFDLVGPPAQVHSAADAFENVLNDVGANKTLTVDGEIVRAIDTLDKKYIADIRAGECVAYVNNSRDGFDYADTAHYAAFRTTLSTTPLATRPEGFDVDADGMPDVWEVANGFDPATDDSAGDADGDGYTNIEEFIYLIDK